MEYLPQDLDRAVQARMITKEARDWANQNRPYIEVLQKNGLNVGNVSDALYKDIVRSIPGVGQFNRWVFDKLTRGAILSSGVVELRRMKSTFPNVPLAKLSGKVANDLNRYYGNLGRQGLFKNPTFQDLARIAFLAPQWVEGMARTELGAAFQTAKIPWDAATKRIFVVGSLAKGVGIGILASEVIAQILNLYFRGQFTFQNPEKGHQLDAWIPSVDPAGHGFWLSPFSVFAELTHDAIRYTEGGETGVESAAHIGSNKLSPLAHSGWTFLSGRTWDNRQLDSTWDRAKEAAMELAPVPIPLSSLTRANSPPGALQRQLTASAGIKTEPAQSARSQLYTMAHKFVRSKGLKQPDLPPSEYRDLDNALRKDDQEQAAKEFEKLKETKSAETIFERYKELGSRNFTGKSEEIEKEFFKKLGPEERPLIQEATQEILELQRRFLALPK